MPIVFTEDHAMWSAEAAGVLPAVPDDVVVKVSISKPSSEGGPWVVCMVAPRVVVSLQEDNEHCVVRQETLTPMAALTDMVSRYLAQRQCKHEWVPQKDPYGQDYPDGRGLCEHCGIAGVGVLPTVPDAHVISMSLDTDVVARCGWPKGGFLQGGTKGVVISMADQKCYGTAFVEAFFPVGDIPRVFIRGEGDDVFAAEQACFSKYQRMVACQSHAWSRTVHGRYRDDGYARCQHCELTATVLAPETRCSVCDIPTSKRLGDKVMCTAHQYALDIEDYVALRQSSALHSLLDAERKGDEIRERITFPIKQYIVSCRGAAFYDTHQTSIIRLLCAFYFQLAQALTGDELSELDQEAFISHPVTEKMRESLLRQIAPILDSFSA